MLLIWEVKLKQHHTQYKDTVREEVGRTHDKYAAIEGGARAEAVSAGQLYWRTMLKS